MESKPVTIHSLDEFFDLFCSQALHPDDDGEKDYARACFMNGCNAAITILLQTHATRGHVIGVLDALHREVVGLAVNRMGVPKQ